MKVLFSKGLALISKPRCASTSLRRALDKHIHYESGDFGVDMSGQMRPFHPHITAPYLSELLTANFPGKPMPMFFICIRHPLAMLYSYYKFFAPDRFSRYNYQQEYRGSLELTFEQWILAGRVGMNPNWTRLAPSSISTDNLSPLSLEAHAYNASNQSLIENIFSIENPREIETWLSTKLGAEIHLSKLNRSSSSSPPKLGKEAIERIRLMMPFESRLYNI